MGNDSAWPSGLARPAGRENAGRSTSQSRIRVHEYRPAAPAAGPARLRRPGWGMHVHPHAAHPAGARGRRFAAPRRTAPQGARRPLTRGVSRAFAWSPS